MGRDVGKLKRQVAHLEAAVKARDTALVESFAAMRHEMDQMWSAVQAAHAGASAASVPPTTSPQPRQDLRVIIERLLKDVPFRKAMVRLILLDLDKAKFITMADVEHRLLSVLPTTAGVSTADFSGVSTRVSLLETEMFKPDGLVALLRKRLKYLEERRANKAVERGNKIFKDQRAVEAFVLTSGNPTSTDTVWIS